MFLKKKKKPSEELRYTIIEISGPQTVKIYALSPKELPENFNAGYAVEIEDAKGNKVPGFIAVRSNLKPLMDVPLIKEFAEKYELVPLDTREIHKLIGQKLLVDLYHDFELVQAGKWGRLAFQKTYEAKPIDWKKVGKILALVIFLAFVGIMLYVFVFPMFSHPAKPVAPPKGQAVT